jgi:transposase
MEAVENNRFVSNHQLRELVYSLFNFTVSKELVRTVIKKARWSFKYPKQYGTPNLKLQEEFLKQREKYQSEGRNFVSLDEVSFGRKGRAKGLAPVGKKLIVINSNKKQDTFSVMGCMSRDKFVSLEIVKGAYNTLLLKDFLTRLDVPKGTVIILDNARFHHSKIVAEEADARGWSLLFPPPYSPWFNPIEGIFSLAKRKYYASRIKETAFDVVQTKHFKAYFDTAMKTVTMPE